MGEYGGSNCAQSISPQTPRRIGQGHAFTNLNGAGLPAHGQAYYPYRYCPKLPDLCSSHNVLTHTVIDISATNILLNFDDSSALDNFVKQELENPSPRKQVGDSIVYASRLFKWPTRGEPVLSDFGSAESGDVRNTRNAGPDLYRAPEIMLGVEWSYSVDIWNVGVMVSYETFRK